MNAQIRSLSAFPLRALSLLMLGLLAGCATQDDLKREVQPYGDRMQSMETWFSAINSGLDTQARRIREVETQMARLEKNDADRSAQIATLSGEAASQSGRLKGAEAAIAGAGTRLDGLDGKLAAMGQRQDGTQDALVRMESRVGVVERAQAQPVAQANAGIQSETAATQPVPAAAATLPAATPAPVTAAPAASAVPAASSADATSRVATLESQLALSLQRGQEQAALLASLNQKLEDMRGELAQMRARSDGNSQAIGLVDTRVDALSSTLESTRARAEAGEKAVADNGIRLTMVQELLKGQSERLSRSEIENGKISATAQEALNRAMQAGKLAEGKLLFETTLSDEITHFGVAEAGLSEAAKKQLDEFAARLKADNRGVFIEIQGHTDNRGPANVNLRLSRDRAQAVRDYLHQVAGIPLHRLAIAAYGESKPVADNKTRNGRNRNRRVMLVVLQ